MHLRELSLAVLLGVSGLLGTTCQPRGGATGGVAGNVADRSPHAASAPPGVVRSNVTRDDYAGSAACEPCHADLYGAWQQSAMHQMTRPIQGARVLAPFDGTVFHFKDDSARLEQVQGERRMSITSPRYGNKTYRVTKVIGGHHREDFVGVEIARGNASPLADGRGTDRIDVSAPSRTSSSSPTSLPEELVLPVSYVFRQKAFRYKGYSVMLPERDGLRAGPVWQKTCILCHNTAPYLTSILGALAGPGTRGYQGEIVDPLLPPEKRWTFAITDDGAFRQTLAKEVDFLHGYAHRSSDTSESNDMTPARAVSATRENFGERHLIEVGIGCESCHGGSKEHVSDPRVRPSFEPHASFLRARPPEVRGLPRPTLNAAAAAREPQRYRAELVNRTCARCHQVLFSGYPYTWEGGSRSRSQGGSNINSGEARDMLLGRCQASCVPCHDPHTRESGGRTRTLESTVSGNAMCTSCHTSLRTAESVRAHARHDPNGAGGLCMGCHMPKKNLSLDGSLTPYHRIGSPTDAIKVERDRPLECALCHTNKSVAAILSDIDRLFGKHSYDESRLRALYPDGSQNALLATLESGKPHEQAVAMHLLGEARDRSATAQIAQQMVHPIPLVRGYADRALESILGSSSPVDLHRENAHIEAATRAWLSGALR